MDTGYMETSKFFRMLVGLTIVMIPIGMFLQLMFVDSAFIAVKQKSHNLSHENSKKLEIIKEEICKEKEKLQKVKSEISYKISDLKSKNITLSYKLKNLKEENDALEEQIRRLKGGNTGGYSNKGNSTGGYIKNKFSGLQNQQNQLNDEDEMQRMMNELQKWKHETQQKIKDELAAEAQKQGDDLAAKFQRQLDETFRIEGQTDDEEMGDELPRSENTFANEMQNLIDETSRIKEQTDKVKEQGKKNAAEIKAELERLSDQLAAREQRKIDEFMAEAQRQVDEANKQKEEASAKVQRHLELVREKKEAEEKKQREAEAQRLIDEDKKNNFEGRLIPTSLTQNDTPSAHTHLTEFIKRATKYTFTPPTTLNQFFEIQNNTELANLYKHFYSIIKDAFFGLSNEYNGLKKPTDNVLEEVIGIMFLCIYNSSAIEFNGNNYVADRYTIRRLFYTIGVANFSNVKLYRFPSKDAFSYFLSITAVYVKNCNLSDEKIFINQLSFMKNITRISASNNPFETFPDFSCFSNLGYVFLDNCTKLKISPQTFKKRLPVEIRPQDKTDGSKPVLTIRATKTNITDEMIDMIYKEFTDEEERQYKIQLEYSNHLIGGL